MPKNIVVGGILCAAMVLGSNRPVGAADRFEVTSIKAVRPTLVNTVDALQKNDLKAAAMWPISGQFFASHHGTSGSHS
jgi:hypothetical protein